MKLAKGQKIDREVIQVPVGTEVKETGDGILLLHPDRRPRRVTFVEMRDHEGPITDLFALGADEPLSS